MLSMFFQVEGNRQKMPYNVSCFPVLFDVMPHVFPCCLKSRENAMAYDHGFHVSNAFLCYLKP